MVCWLASLVSFVFIVAVSCTVYPGTANWDKWGDGWQAGYAKARPPDGGSYVWVLEEGAAPSEVGQGVFPLFLFWFVF